MKLNTNKRVMLCSKALYSEQLKCYASLCECYQALAEHLGHNATALDVQKRYSKYLSLASNGNLDFLNKENNYIFSENYKGARFQASEAKLFKEYAKQARTLRQFKEGSAILSEALCEDGAPYKDVLSDYESYMKQTSPQTRKFHREVSEHSPAYIGHTYFVKSRNSIRTIRNVDSSHLDSLPVSMELAPSQFGATISGVTSMKEIIDITKEEARYVDTPEERLEYSKKPGLVQESGYRFFAKNQKGLALSLAALVAIGAAAGIASEIKTAHNYNSLNIDTLSENGYKTDLSQKTITSINNISKQVEEMQNQSTLPTKDELMNVGSTIDDLFDDILEEKITPSFLESHPDAKDVSVDHHYNYNDPEAPYKAVIISYTDAEGNKQEERITHFSSASMLSSQDMSQVFEHEYDIDGSYSDISKIFSSSGNYVSNSKDIDKVLNEYSNNIDFMKHFASTKLTYKDGSLFGILPASIKSDMPEKSEAQTSHDNISGNRSIEDDDAR